MGKSQREKGKRTELQIAAWFRALGFSSARRGRQHSGSPDSPDVVVPELPNIRVEVKSRARFPPKTEIRKWLERAEMDAGLHARAVLLVVARRVSPVLVYRNGDAIVAVLESSPASARGLLTNINSNPSLTPAHVPQGTGTSA